MMQKSCVLWQKDQGRGVGRVRQRRHARPAAGTHKYCSAVRFSKKLSARVVKALLLRLLKEAVKQAKAVRTAAETTSGRQPRRPRRPTNI